MHYGSQTAWYTYMFAFLTIHEANLYIWTPEHRQNMWRGPCKVSNASHDYPLIPTIWLNTRASLTLAVTNVVMLCVSACVTVFGSSIYSSDTWHPLDIPLWLAWYQRNVRRNRTPCLWRRSWSRVMKRCVCWRHACMHAWWGSTRILHLSQPTKCRNIN